MTDLSSLTADQLAETSMEDLSDGIHDVLSDSHRGPGTADGVDLDGCPGCWAHAALTELCRRLKTSEDALDTARAFVATTSYYRQTKASRPAFEALALDLAAIRPNPKP